MSYFGSFHPLLVHLPIGILIFASVADLLTLRKPGARIRVSLPVMYLIGAITAILSCISGYLLFQTGDYTGILVSRHQWMGIATAVISSLQWFLTARTTASVFRRFLPGLLFIVLVVTGHLGGSLTHGEAYLLENAPAVLKDLFTGSPEKINRPGISNVQQSLVYKDLAAQVFQEKCVGCHGPNKQKGGLRLDAPEWIQKGGKHGEVLAPGSPEESELFRRLVLPMNDDDHMPPKEKNQLSKQELALLHWWISQGGDFSRKVSELAQGDSMQRILKSFEDGSGEKSGMRVQQPGEPKQAADPRILEALRRAGVIVLPLASGSRNLQVSFLNATGNPDSLMALVSSLSPQLISLNIGQKAMTDQGLAHVKACHRLQKLYLNGTAVTDRGLTYLQGLGDLQYLNLSNTAVTAEGLKSLQACSGLKLLYLFGIRMNGSSWETLRKSLPQCTIDTGGYRLPSLQTDTETVKDTKRKT